VVEKKAARKLRARREPQRTVWFGLGMFGLVGWSVAIPAVAGVALGLWIDRTWPGRVSWTLTLLVAGVAVGCLTAWRWISREGHHG
jgi:ATP synthase protein I